MKLCKKCKTKIPNRIKIEDKWRTTCNRKYCTTCSPWKNHNTKKLEKPEYSGVGKFCKKCNQIRPLVEFMNNKNCLHSTCKFCRIFEMKQKWIDYKKRAILYKGGKCIKCGYDKNYAALDFNHIDPSKKECGWTQLKTRSWENIIKELDKCDLMCKNCHSELHNKS